MRIVVVVILSLMASACSRFYSMAPRSVIKTVGNLSILSSASVMATGKTLPDHVVSFQSGKDCSTVRVEQGRSYCKEDEANPMPVVYCYRTLGDVMCYSKPDPTRKPGDQIGNL